MKRYGNIYAKIYDMENLKLAHENARKDKLYYKEVKMVDGDPETYLKQIQDMLINKTYEVSEYEVSTMTKEKKGSCGNFHISLTELFNGQLCFK